MHYEVARLTAVSCLVALTLACRSPAGTSPSTADGMWTPPTPSPEPPPVGGVLVATTPSPYKLTILAYDNELGGGGPGGIAVAPTVQVLDGPRAGERYSTLEFSQLPEVMWPVTVRLSADGYASKDVVLSESTGHRRNPISGLYDFPVPLTFVGDASTDTFIRTLSSTAMEAIHAFTVASAGGVTVRTWWSVDYNDRLFVDLSCNGQLVKSTEQMGYSSGGGFTQNVSMPGPCQLKVRQFKSDAGTRYRVAITYPK